MLASPRGILWGAPSCTVVIHRCQAAVSSAPRVTSLSTDRFLEHHAGFDYAAHLIGARPGATKAKVSGGIEAREVDN